MAEEDEVYDEVDYEAEHQAVLKTLKKRRNIYSLIVLGLVVVGGVCGALIPDIGLFVMLGFAVVWGIFAGFAMMCINNYRYQKSGGRKQGGGLWWGLLFIVGLIIVPLITVVLCNKSKFIAQKILGVVFYD